MTPSGGDTRTKEVEFDIRRMADGELAAFHDPRTREGAPLAQISYVRLCELAGYEVPRVADVIALTAGTGPRDALALRREAARAG